MNDTCHTHNLTWQYVSEVAALQVGVRRRRQGVVPLREAAHHSSVTQGTHGEHQRESRGEGAKGGAQAGDGHRHALNIIPMNK